LHRIFVKNQRFMFKTTLDKFRTVAFLEGCSFILFGITMPLKYMLGFPKPNYFVGMAHGVLFILYVFLLALVAYQYKWSLTKIALAFLASFVPFGTFYADKKLFRA
jgi:integral membrane protein